MDGIAQLEQLHREILEGRGKMTALMEAINENTLEYERKLKSAKELKLEASYWRMRHERLLPWARSSHGSAEHARTYLPAT